MKEFKEIKTGSDYSRACTRVGELFGAKRDTPEFTELMHVIDLMDEYMRKKKWGFK